jgi:asparagine synthetase B (glutamine-hydrolysing)
LIAVSFDPRGRGDETALQASLAPLAAQLTVGDAFRAAHAAPAHSAQAGAVLCLLEGDVINRSELCETLGVSHATQAAAVVALAFATWGVEGFARLRGTFAIAVWDRVRQRGALVTDHCGVQPWYLQRSSRRVLAATSMRSLVRMLPSAPPPDPIRTMGWLASQFPSGAETFARGVECLAGGHAVVIAGDVATLRRWWHPVYRDPLRASRDELVARFRGVLHAAVRDRLSRDLPTGVILSGGFDSSAVTGVAASENAARGNLRTYSAGFPDDAEIDESARVDALVDARGLPGHLIRPEPQGTLRVALEYQRDWGIPCAGPGYLLERPLLERAAREGTDVILDGQGGDEVFGFSPYLIADRARRGDLRAAHALLSHLPDQDRRASGHDLRYQLREYVVRPLLPAQLERRLRARGDATRHLPPWLRRDRLDLFLAADTRQAWKQTGEGPLWWRHRLYLMTNARSGLAEYIGHRGRDLALRMRPPLFDVNLTELALRIPPELGFGGVNRALARDSVAGDVPDSVRLAARKSDLQPFYHRALSGADLASIRLLLEPADARVYEYVDRARTLELLAGPAPAVGDPGWRRWSVAIWPSVTAEIALRSLEDERFAQRFIEVHEPPAPAHTEIR